MSTEKNEEMEVRKEEARASAEGLVQSWTSEVMNALFTLASEKKLPENLTFNGVSMTTTFFSGDKVCVNFQFGIMGGKK